MAIERRGMPILLVQYLSAALVLCTRAARQRPSFFSLSPSARERVRPKNSLPNPLLNRRKVAHSPNLLVRVLLMR